jgi:hypothetical protein
MAERARASGLAFLPDHFVIPAGAPDPKLRHVGIQVAPDDLGPMHDSFGGVFRLAGSKPRTLTGVDGGAVASSAVHRRDEAPDYHPPGLEAYLASGGRVAPLAQTAQPK